MSETVPIEKGIVQDAAICSGLAKEALRQIALDSTPGSNKFTSVATLAFKMEAVEAAMKTVLEEASE